MATVSWNFVAIGRPTTGRGRAVLYLRHVSQFSLISLKASNKTSSVFQGAFADLRSLMILGAGAWANCLCNFQAIWSFDFVDELEVKLYQLPSDCEIALESTL